MEIYEKSGMNAMYTSTNIERFTGFADLYDRFRPSPPAILAEILTRLARTPFPQLVVDLGSGSGLSTRYWAEKAEAVIGVEPSADMRRQAVSATEALNITYRPGMSHDTGLPAGCAQVVTASQALHWMEPQPTFEEVRRILNPGGVFAAFDYDWPPTTGNWEADAAYDDCIHQARILESQLPDAGVLPGDKAQHLRRMQTSGCFCYIKEVVIHHVDEGNSDRLVGLALSQGGVQTLFKHGYTEADIGIDRLRQVATRTLGIQPQKWYWSSRVRIGITR
jgi:SAM-dependent methyltransferase